MFHSFQEPLFFWKARWLPGRERQFIISQKKMQTHLFEISGFYSFRDFYFHRLVKVQFLGGDIAFISVKELGKWLFSLCGDQYGGPQQDWFKPDTALGTGMHSSRASQVAVVVKNPLPMQEMKETWVRFLGGEALFEKEVATYCSVLAWRFPWTEEPGRLQSTGSQIVRHNWRDLARTHTHKCSKSIGWKSARSPLGQVFLLLKKKVQGRERFCPFSQCLCFWMLYLGLPQSLSKAVLDPTKIENCRVEE